MKEKQTPSMQGRAVLFSGAGKALELKQFDVPALAEDQILVKNLYTTLCGSDLHTYCGHRKEPDEVVLGHEIVGEIVSVGPAHPGVDYQGRPVTIGDRVVWSIFAAPAGVEAPRADMPQKSAGLFKYGHALATPADVFSGGLADYCILKGNTAFLKISSDMPLGVAATIGCAHATTRGALRVAGEISGKRVLIFGAGLLGLSCAAMCKDAGASFIGMVDTVPSRLEWAPKFGVDSCYVSGAADLTMPEVDLVFDMTGHPAAMKMGIDALGLGGCAVWIGAVFPAAPVAIDAEKVVRNILQIKGLHNYNYEDFAGAADFVERCYKAYPFDALVEKEFPLDESEEAFIYANNNKPVRAGIRI